MNGNKRKGFASMDKARHKAITSRGGKNAHASGKAHRFTHNEAVKNGKKAMAIRWGKSEKTIFSENKINK